MIGRLVAQKDETNPVATVTWDPKVKFSFAVLHDYAELSEKVISERSKYFATYQIVSTWPMDYAEYIGSVEMRWASNSRLRSCRTSRR